MLKKLRKLYHVYKELRNSSKTKNIVNPKTGLSRSEIERIKSTPSFTTGAANFFSQEFHYSHGMSLLHSVQEIFEDEIYKFKSDIKNPYIIDCGANIGLSIFYFKKLFPESTIVAFEPDDKIFNLLEKNILQINADKKITINKEAVWTCDTELSFFSEGALAGSSVTDFGKKNDVIKVKAIDLKKYLNKKIDFLKIDIEGAENEVIFDIAPLLHNVKNLFLEYHGIINQPQNLGEILNLLKENGFEYYIRLAADTIQFPFYDIPQSSFNQQLNIFCYRK